MSDDDMGDLLAPKSQQLDAVDLISGARTFTVKSAKKTAGEQPLSIYFEEFDRPWKPGVNQRRVIGNVWGTKMSAWTGRRLTLHCDASVVYGGKAVGGIRVTHMSHIEKRTPTPVIPTRGQGSIYNVDPLPDVPATPTPPSADDINGCTDRDTLIGWWHTSPPNIQELIKARVTDLDNQPGADQ